jgi:hypothetical protein
VQKICMSGGEGGLEEGGCSAYYIPCYDREDVSAIIQ